MPQEMSLARYEGAVSFDLVEVSGERAVGRMDVGDGALNAQGTISAGALIWFADTIATSLALKGEPVKLGMSGYPQTVTLNAQLLDCQSTGRLKATARFVRKGRRLHVVHTQVEDGDGTVLVEATSTHIPTL